MTNDKDRSECGVNFIDFIVINDIVNRYYRLWGGSPGGLKKGEGELMRKGSMVPYPGDLKYTGRGEGNRG